MAEHKYACVMAGGRGLKDQEGRSLLLSLAEKRGAFVIATRGAVEDGLLDESLLVGMSHMRVTTDLYIGFGLSGSNFHTAGVRGNPVMVGINPDRKARIHELADISILRDCKEVMREWLTDDGAWNAFMSDVLRVYSGQ